MKHSAQKPEQFIFRLLQENLEPDVLPDRNTPTFSNRVLSVLMVVSAIAALIIGFALGVIPK
jgi:hypothetical protein